MKRIGKAALIAAMAGASAAAWAERRPLDTAATREQAFWVCDYVATTRGVLHTPIDQCTRATENLKVHKFGGDYGRMVQWWRERKAIEHRKLRLLQQQ